MSDVGGLIATMKENGFKYQRGEIEVSLAESYGFCWGVERAVQMAYEARKQYPNEDMHITNEIIHNPTVNQVRKTSQVSLSLLLNFLGDRAHCLTPGYNVTPAQRILGLCATLLCAGSNTMVSQSDGTFALTATGIFTSILQPRVHGPCLSFPFFWNAKFAYYANAAVTDRFY